MSKKESTWGILPPSFHTQLALSWGTMITEDFTLFLTQRFYMNQKYVLLYWRILHSMVNPKDLMYVAAGKVSWFPKHSPGSALFFTAPGLLIILSLFPWWCFIVLNGGNSGCHRGIGTPTERKRIFSDESVSWSVLTAGRKTPVNVHVCFLIVSAFNWKNVF